MTPSEIFEGENSSLRKAFENVTNKDDEMIMTNFVEVEKTIDEEVNELIDSMVADVHFEKTWPAHTAYYQIDLNQFQEKLRTTLATIRADHERELEEVRSKELELLAVHLDRQLAGYTSVDLGSIYRYIQQRQESLTPPELLSDKTN